MPKEPIEQKEETVEDEKYILITINTKEKKK